MKAARNDEARNFLGAKIAEALQPNFRGQTFQVRVFGCAKNLHSLLGEVSVETGKRETWAVDGRFTNFPMKTNARSFQFHVQLFGMRSVKTFHSDDRHSFLPRTARRGNGRCRLLVHWTI